MNRFARMSPAIIVALLIGMVSGCDWEPDSTGFNTSQWAGIEINFSGTYVSRVSGGELIEGSDIVRLTINQTGNRLTVTDSNGVTYEGVTGAPGTVTEPLEVAADGTPRYPEGALISLMQITFWREGPSPSVHDDVRFSGQIRLIAVTDIEGNTSQTDLNINVPPVDINTSSTTTYSVDESNSMMVLEGQWTAGETISWVNGWSQNYMQFWDIGHTHTFPSGDSSGGGPAPDPAAP